MATTMRLFQFYCVLNYALAVHSKLHSQVNTALWPRNSNLHQPRVYSALHPDFQNSLSLPNDKWKSVEKIYPSNTFPFQAPWGAGELFSNRSTDGQSSKVDHSFRMRNENVSDSYFEGHLSKRILRGVFNEIEHIFHYANRMNSCKLSNLHNLEEFIRKVLRSYFMEEKTLQETVNLSPLDLHAQHSPSQNQTEVNKCSVNHNFRSPNDAELNNILRCMSPGLVNYLSSKVLHLKLFIRNFYSQLKNDPSTFKGYLCNTLFAKADMHAKTCSQHIEQVLSMIDTEDIFHAEHRKTHERPIRSASKIRGKFDTDYEDNTGTLYTEVNQYMGTNNYDHPATVIEVPLEYPDDEEKKKPHKVVIKLLGALTLGTYGIISVLLLRQFILLGSAGVGPPGLPGAKGMAGDKGMKGSAGMKGIKGSAGEKGMKGDKGDRGDQGLQGHKGPKGMKGNAGNPGPKGEQGDLGPTGYPGPQGEPGAPGMPSTKGEKGSPGEPTVGSKGGKGDSGPNGMKGNNGIKGDSIKGEPGDEGMTGMKGTTEPNGDNGATGPKGEAGPPGPNDRKGTEGENKECVQGPLSLRRGNNCDKTHAAQKSRQRRNLADESDASLLLALLYEGKTPLDSRKKIYRMNLESSTESATFLNNRGDVDTSRYLENQKVINLHRDNFDENFSTNKKLGDDTEAYDAGSGQHHKKLRSRQVAAQHTFGYRKHSAKPGQRFQIYDGDQDPITELKDTPQLLSHLYERKEMEDEMSQKVTARKCGALDSINKLWMEHQDPFGCVKCSLFEFFKSSNEDLESYIMAGLAHVLGVQDSYQVQAAVREGRINNRNVECQRSNTTCVIVPTQVRYEESTRRSKKRR